MIIPYRYTYYPFNGPNAATGIREWRAERYVNGRRQRVLHLGFWKSLLYNLNLIYRDKSY